MVEQDVELTKQDLEGDPQKPLVLTHRDIAVFKLIHEHRFSPYNQIRIAFWRDRSRESNSCYGRIERLVKEGYLEKDVSKRRSLPVFFITEVALKELRSRGLDSDLVLYKKTDDFDRNADHDLKVLSLRLLFAYMGLDNWRSERVLKERDSKHRIPDGVLIVKGFKIAIEMENYMKSAPRYGEIFQYYGENKEYSLVFMIMDEGLKDWLLKMNYDTKRIWFAGYNDLFKHEGETLFENRNASFLLNRIL
mgnify:CR=1 FL=1